MEYNSNLTLFGTCYSIPNQHSILSSGLTDLPTLAKGTQEFEEDTTSFSNSTVETEWEQFPFCHVGDSLMNSEDNSSENSICPQDGSFCEKHNDSLFDFSDEIDYIQVSYSKKTKYIACRNRLRGKVYKKKKRNVILEGWNYIRKFFLKYLTCKNVLVTVKKDFNANFKLWRGEFKGYYNIFIKFAHKLPRTKVSLGFLKRSYSSDPQITAISDMLRRLFNNFIEEKAEMCINRLQRTSPTMKEIVLELIKMLKKTIKKNQW